MPYKFAIENIDYSDLAAGRVLYSQPGQVAFPVRLASEIFQRCLGIRSGRGLSGPVSIYDPCCGGGYLLTVLGFLHGDAISAIAASDISPQALDLAMRNLSLLSLLGLDRRGDELSEYFQVYGKASHQTALESVFRLRCILDQAVSGRQLPTILFRADAFKTDSMRYGLAGLPVDLVMTDIPYGWKSAWVDSIQPGEDHRPEASSLPPKGLSVGDNQTGSSLVGRMLEALHPILPPGCLVAIASDKAQKIVQPDYKRLDRFQVGKRQVTILSRSHNIACGTQAGA
jgi:hypothetical protein